ncbi:MAG: MFS transporter, partial [Bacteroidales bacterium]
AYIGIGTGGFIVFQIAAYLINNLGWRLALICIGLLMILISFPFAFFIKEPPNTTIQERKDKSSVPIKDVLKNPHFYLLALGSMCSIAAVGGTNQHLKLYLRDLHYSQVQAANVASLVLFSSIAGRLFVGWLADVLPRKYVMIIVYMIVATAIPLLLVPEFPGRIYLFAVFFGIGLGGDYMIIPLMAGDLFGVKVLGRVMGVVLVADGIAESLSPMMVGALYNKLAEGYTLGFLVLIIIALTGAFFVSFLPKHKKEYSTE